MANGYWQQLLRVDLSFQKSRVETIPVEDLRAYIGGAGLAASFLLRETRAGVNPLSGENRLFFATGPFQGSGVSGSAKFSVAGISPLTGTFADSAAGASFGVSLKAAGYDMLVLQGRAPHPVYLAIEEENVILHDARHLWGLDSYACIDALAGLHSGASVAAIGEAGEKQVALACIVFDKHSFAGRCGLGAVMGAMNIKAVAVTGHKSVLFHDPALLAELAKKGRRAIVAVVKESGFREHGTPAYCKDGEAAGDSPIKYWMQDAWPEGAAKLSAPHSTEVLRAKPHPCKYCPAGCHRDVVVEEPGQYSMKGSGPEYETLAMMGSNLLIDDPKAVAKANDLTNRYGMDTISMGSIAGFCMECWEKGLLTAEDTDGIDCSWGSPDALLQLIEKVGTRSGFGARFARGTLQAAKLMGNGAEALVTHVKGLDLPAHDPRSTFSLGVTYATTPRGACHFRGAAGDIEAGFFSLPEAGLPPGFVRPFHPENQSKLAAIAMDFFGLLNSAVLCGFMCDGGGVTFSEVRDLFNAATGWNYSCDELLLAGGRGVMAGRLINLRDGFDATTDVLPPKMFRAAKEGYRAGKVPPMEQLIKEYYAVRNWDEQGYPTEECLKTFGFPGGLLRFKR